MNFAVGKAKDDEPELEQPAHAGIIPKTHFRWILSGPSKSGKSNLAKWSLDKFYVSSKGRGKSFFDKIYLLSPTANIDFMWANLNGLEHRNRISHPTPATLSGILNAQIKYIAGSSSESALKNVSSKTLASKKQSSKKVLVIFDDAIAESKLINSPEFLKIFIQGRHYNISSMVMTQSYMRVPRSVRLQATHLSLFPSRSTEIDRVFHEFGPKSLTKKEFTEMVQFATRPEEGDMYPFLHVDAFAPEKTRFRRNFTHTLEIKDDLESNPIPQLESGGDDDLSSAPKSKFRQNKKSRKKSQQQDAIPPPSKRRKQAAPQEDSSVG
jgi:hypothetical protein